MDNYIPDLTKLAKLKFSNSIPIIESSLIPDEIIHLLKTKRLFPCRRDEQRNVDSANTQIMPCIFDLLGCYEITNDSSRIVLYRKLCAIVAQELKIPLENLLTIVLIHETAHAVSHLGQDEFSNIWEHFNLAPTADKELVAQLMTYLYCRETDAKHLMEVFQTLTNHEDSRYTSWRRYESSSTEEIVQIIQDTRRRHPFYDLIIDFQMGGGGPIGICGSSIHYRIKGKTATFLDMQTVTASDPNPGHAPFSGEWRTKTQRCLNYILSLMNDNNQTIPEPIFQLVDDLKGTDNFSLNENDIYFSIAIIDLIEAFVDLDIDSKYYNIKQYSIETKDLINICESVRNAMRIDNKNYTTFGVMDAPSHILVVYLEGEWRIWWGNVGWKGESALENLENIIRTLAKRISA
jgi:hypothetical protein